MRAIEAECFKDFDTQIIMESAGRAVAERVLAWLRGKRAERVLVVCGKGNNGADGLVAARWLAQQGATVSVFMAETKDLAPLCERNLRRLPPAMLTTDLPLACAKADVVVDALLGIGARTPLKKPYAHAVAAMNEHARFIVALDVPTPDLHAHETVTLHAWKAEMTQLPDRARCGEIVLADIGIPDALFAATDGYVIDARYVQQRLPLERAKPGRSNSHKGTFGHVGLVGGAKGKDGAITLAALAALRAGAGLATVLGATKAPRPEIMTAPLDTQLDRFTVFCVGPGGAPSLAALQTKVPVVLDADALSVLPKTLGVGPRILTPHPLEFARLTGSTVDAVQNDRIGAAQRAARSLRAIIVLKGANTVVADPSGAFGVCPIGGRELSKGGSGDVLAGIIAGLAGQRGMDPFTAATAGVYLHALAAEIAASTKAKASVLASEIAERLPDAMRTLEQRV